MQLEVQYDCGFKIYFKYLECLWKALLIMNVETLQSEQHLGGPFSEELQYVEYRKTKSQRADNQDTARRWPSVRQEGGSHQGPN